MQHDCKGITQRSNGNWYCGKYKINYCPFCGKDLIRITCKECEYYDFDDELQPDNRKHPGSGVWKHKCKAGMMDKFSSSNACKSKFKSTNKI